MPAFLSFLSLGDSYTIGESVLLTESFPYQTVQALRKKGLLVQGPEIVAKTGWTTHELLSAMANYQFLPTYDIVTLLIGVNNQYRGQSVTEFATDFEVLIRKAIQLAGGQAQKVFVLSIPDWGTTAFAEGRDRAAIANSIDSFNSLKRWVTEQYQVRFLDNTDTARKNRRDKEWIAADGLHPSAKEYDIWATQLSKAITEEYEY